MPDTALRHRVAVVDHRFADLDVERTALADIGAEVVDAGGRERAEAIRLCEDVDGILLGARLKFDDDALAGLKRCRVIVRYGVGTDNVDVAAAARRKITIANVPDYCVEEVATHALAMILALNRRLFVFDKSVRSGRWELGPGAGMRRLSECTLGILGFGRIGESLGRHAAALGLRVLVVDPVRSQADIAAAGARASSLGMLLRESDFISIHAPRSPGAPPILGAPEIAAMKPGVVLINVARGGLLDETALVASLRDGRVGGAALDVADREPPGPDSPLLDAPNVILTPHVAWYSTSAAIDLRRKAAEEVARVLGGHQALNPVTTDR